MVSLCGVVQCDVICISSSSIVLMCVFMYVRARNDFCACGCMCVSVCVSEVE